jgi:hypothetical protein
MPQLPEEIAGQIRVLIEPGTRGRLVARGLARGMIWREGKLPEDAPGFAPGLSSDLLDHGFLILAKSLQLRDAARDNPLLPDAFRVAAECIESAVRRESRDREGRGFYLVVSAAAFHLAHFAARSYCLVPEDPRDLNLSTPEKVLVRLMRRDLSGLRDVLRTWLNDPELSDSSVATRLVEAAAATADDADAEIDFEEDEEEEGDGSQFGIDDAISIAVTRLILVNVARFDYALRSGNADGYGGAVEGLMRAAEAAAEARLVPLWWVATLARHLIDDLWDFSLHQRLPRARGPEDGAFDDLRARFIRVLTGRGVAEVDLWPSQLEAARRSINVSDDLVVALPTSAGKTRIAELCILRALADGGRVVYVTPLRALSAQIERGLTRTFRPLGFSVSSLYGASGVTLEDVQTLTSAHVVVCTPEKLDFSIRQDPAALADVALIVLDEGHMIGEGTREIRYEVLVQRLLSRADAHARRIVCLSAVFGAGESFEDFTQWLRSDDPGTPIRSEWRPTRQRSGILEWAGGSGRLTVEVDGETPFVPHFVRARPPQRRRRREYPQNDAELTVATVQALVEDDQRVLVYCPEKRSVESLGEVCLALSGQGYLAPLVNDLEPLAKALRLAAEWLGPRHVAARALELGIGIHHGGLPRPFLMEIERLLTQRVLRVAIASPTVAQGLDLSCSALVFRSIYRGGQPIEPKEYSNVVGRAGRAFVDLDGLTIYPVMEPIARTRRMKIAAYRRLQADARARQLESGLVLLIRKITEWLAFRLGRDVNRMMEYVANQNVGPWEHLRLGGPNGRPQAQEEDDGDGDLEAFVADLDTAVFSAIEDLDAPVERLAEILDAALASSLWKRRLERCPAGERRQQRELLHARARWLWAHSTGTDRRACFSAGVGHTAGQRIKANLDGLLQVAVAAETALLQGDVEAGVEAITLLATTLLTFHPFRGDLPAGWEAVLAGWVRGTPVGEMVGMLDGKESTLISEAFVYRLVWAVEAVRVQGAATGDLRADLLEGLLARVLTYGLPSPQGTLLAQAGLASRTMIARILEAFPARFTTPTQIGPWLRGVQDRIGRDFWEDAGSNALWRSFVQSWRTATEGTWINTEGERPVEWLDGIGPLAPGDAVQLVDDLRTGHTLIYSEDLSLLGRLREREETGEGAYVEAHVASLDSIVVRRFGSRLAA